MKKIWLDDVRPAPKEWVWIRTAEDCLLYLELWWDDISEISLDHDLGENIKTGYDVAKFIEEQVIVNGKRLPIVRIHSANPVGRKNMEAALISATRAVSWKQ